MAVPPKPTNSVRKTIRMLIITLLGSIGSFFVYGAQASHRAYAFTQHATLLAAFFGPSYWRTVFNGAVENSPLGVYTWAIAALVRISSPPVLQLADPVFTPLFQAVTSWVGQISKAIRGQPQT